MPRSPNKPQTKVTPRANQPPILTETRAAWRRAGGGLVGSCTLSCDVNPEEAPRSQQVPPPRQVASRLSRLWAFSPIYQPKQVGRRPSSRTAWEVGVVILFQFCRRGNWVSPRRQMADPGFELVSSPRLPRSPSSRCPWAGSRLAWASDPGVAPWLHRACLLDSARLWGWTLVSRLQESPVF